MGKETLAFGDIGGQKKSYRHKSCVPLRDVEFFFIIIDFFVFYKHKCI